jgi:hypothetical protein
MKTMRFIMEMSMLFCTLAISQPSIAKKPSQGYPTVTLSIPNSVSTIFYGETAYIPLQMTFTALRGLKDWIVPAEMSLRVQSGTCPSIPRDEVEYGNGVCNMAITISGKTLGKTIHGQIQYAVRDHKERWNGVWKTPQIKVAVVPHNLSMSTIPEQNATTHIPFHIDLSQYISFYAENVQAGIPPQIIVSPEAQNGMHFDHTQLAIMGEPINTGISVFSVMAKNSRSSTQATRLAISVANDPKDKPILKLRHPIPSATLGRRYTLNLMDLLELKSGSILSNQIVFRIVQDKFGADWVQISKENPMLLEGLTPDSAALQAQEVTLIASSNTGGDSSPLSITIPIADDVAKKPVVSPFTLKAQAEDNFYMDIGRHIQNPNEDKSLVLVLEKIEPRAPWLHISKLSPTALEANVPEDAAGQLYHLTMHANTQSGGNSDPVSIPLQIAVNKQLTPHFKTSHPELAILYPGTPYVYDFVDQSDIFPSYQEVPYHITFAHDSTYPVWLRIENNKLIAEEVPENVTESPYIWLIIHNTPGGDSEKIKVKLKVAGL